MQKTILFFITATWVASSVFTAHAQTTTEKRPNIIFLLSDDQVDLSVGAYGNDQVKTPNMDQLAREGTLFRNHYNTTSICMASRVNCMTGMYEYKTGCNFNHGPLNTNSWLKSYPILLRKAGYFTGFAGKFGFDIKQILPNDEPALKGPDKYFDMYAGGTGQTSYETASDKNSPALKAYAEKYPHSSRAYAAWADDFLREAKKSGKPFCLSISFKAPHLPFTPDGAFDDVYAKTDFRKPSNYGTKNASHFAPQAIMGRQFTGYRFWIDDYQNSIRKYNQLIHGVDTAIGMIRQSLKEQGLADNTVIIFTSDNGYSCGAHGFGGKVLPYEEASRSPLIIVDPRLPEKYRGQERDFVTGNIDMAPTIFDLAGAPVPENIDGVSLKETLTDTSDVNRKSLALLNVWAGRNQALSIVTKDWKYIFWFDGSQSAPAEELYNIAKDRTEMNNLAADPKYADQLAVMRHLYDKHHSHVKEEGVDHNKYAIYKTLLDRNLLWPDKVKAMQKQPSLPKKNKKKKK